MYTHQYMMIIMINILLIHMSAYHKSINNYE